MKLVHLVVITVLLSLLAVPKSYGQANRNKPTIEFSCLLWEGPLPEPIYFNNGEEYIEVKPFTTSRSAAHKMLITKQFTLYVKREEENEKGEVVMVYKAVGSTAIPSGMKKILFIIFLGDKDADEVPQINMIAFDDSTTGFPKGSFRFVNFTSAALKVKFAGSSKNLPAKEATIMRSKVTNKGGLIPFIIYSAKGTVVYQTRLFAQTNGREIIFIRPPKQRGELPQVKYIAQLFPKVVPQPAGAQ